LKEKDITKDKIPPPCISNQPKNRSGGWLVLAYLEVPQEFPMASTCLELSVTNHLSADRQVPQLKIYINLQNTNLDILFE
jgi:hypothetical protein